MNQHFIADCRTLYNASVRCKISLEYCKSACLRIRIVDRSDNFRILVHAPFNILTHCLSCYSQAVCMEQTFLVQLIHNCVNSTCLVQVFHISVSCRSKVAQIWCLLTDSICKINLKIHSDLMSDCRKMKHTVRRTSQCHIYCQCIQNCIFCHDISRTDILSHQFHHLHTCMLCKLNPCGIYCRNRTISFQSHTKCLSQAVHAVGCIHT